MRPPLPVSDRGVLAFLGVVATGTATALYLAPDALLQSVQPAVEAALTAFEPRTLMLVGAACAGLATFGKIIAARSGPPTGEEAIDASADTAADGAVVGGRFDARVASTRAAIDDPRRTADTEAVRDEIHSTAVDAMVAVEGRSREEAEERVATGAWTDDDVVAAFLGGADAPHMPFLNRVSAWLYPAAAFERRVRRTIDALHARQGAPDRGRTAAGSADTADDSPADPEGRD